MSVMRSAVKRSSSRSVVGALEMMLHRARRAEYYPSSHPSPWGGEPHPSPAGENKARCLSFHAGGLRLCGTKQMET
jgi:hypothetical protein